MKNNIQIITIDRIEENIVIAYTDDGKSITFSKEFYDVHENDICEATFDTTGKLVSVQILKVATEKRKNSLKSRLKRLFTK